MSYSNVKKMLAAGLVVAALAVPVAAAGDDDSWWPRMGRMMGEWGPGQMMGQMMGRWGPMSGPMMGLGTDAMIDRIDGRLAFLKTELKVTEAQEAAWKEFEEAVRSTARTHNDMMRSMMEEFQNGEFLDKSLIDRLTLQETHLEARLEQVRTVKGATEKLYALLSDEQKEVADETVLPMMGMGMGRMRGFGPRKGG